MDLAKVYPDYARGRTLQYTDLIRHVAGSYAAFVQLHQELNHSQLNGDDYPLFIHIGHCILAHHGKKEWGSPVEPYTHEAKIIHEADMDSTANGPGKCLASAVK